MGLFDKFNKNKSNQKGNGIDMNNPIIRKMVEWIEHPMEFGKKPDSIKIIDERTLFWPTQQKEQCYLCEYKVDGDQYIGFTGPITWSFFAADLSSLSKEEIYLRYAGWFICFSIINSDVYDKSKEGLNEGKVIAELNQMGIRDISISQQTFLGKETYYEFVGTKDGAKVKIVGTEGDMHLKPFDAILPYFEYVGLAWDPFNLS